MGRIRHHGRRDAAGLRRSEGLHRTQQRLRLTGRHRADLRASVDDLQLQLAGVPAASDGRCARTALQVTEEDDPGECPADLRSVPVDADHDPADGIPDRSDRRLHRCRPGQHPEVHQRLLTVDLRHPYSPRLPIHGAAGSALADQRHHAAEHPDSRFRLHPGSDGRMELRLLRRYRRRALPGLAGARRPDAPDRDRRTRRRSTRRYLRAVAVRNPSALQTDLSTNAGGLSGGRSHHRSRRRRQDERIRLHLTADHPGIRQHGVVCVRHHRSVHHLDGPGHLFRIPLTGASRRTGRRGSPGR